MPEGKSKIRNQKSKVELKTSKAKEVGKTAIKAQKAVSLSVPSFTLEGKESDSLVLPEELFGSKVNKQLLNQALRVYLNNLKGHFGNTKTRSEVRGSTRKVRTQKGTGGARHGSIKAPIFVGGGIAIGPKFRKVILDLPKKMKKAALKSALSYKLSAGEVIGVSDLEKAQGKTRQMQNFLKVINKKSVLLVTDGKNNKVAQAGRNLPMVLVERADQLNVLDIMKYQTLIFSKEGLDKLHSRLKGEKE